MASPTQHSDSAPTCSTTDMVLIHKVFRHVYRDAPDLIRGVAAGDVTRVRVVGPYVRGLVQGLHRHHHTEDILLWDTLEQRSAGCAIHVSLMKAQHAAVARLIEQVDAALPAWEDAAGADERDRIAELFDQIRTALETHLGQEEELILPVAATTMTQQEWDRLGEHGRAGVPKNEQFLQLGWMVDALGPQDGARFLREFLPPPVRLLWATLGKRQFAKHKRLVYGL